MIFINVPSILLPFKLGQNCWDSKCRLLFVATTCLCSPLNNRGHTGLSQLPECRHLLGQGFPEVWLVAVTGSPQEGKQWFSLNKLRDVSDVRAGHRLPVGVLRAHVHLEEDPLGESLKALPAFPEMPVTELGVELAGGGGAGEDSLVFHVNLVKS
jgi:hypothetical protein